MPNRTPKRTTAGRTTERRTESPIYRAFDPTPGQQRIWQLLPLAEMLARAVLTSVCATSEDPYTSQDAIETIERELEQIDTFAPRDEDEHRGRQMVRLEQAAFLVGFALGKQLGPDLQLEPGKAARRAKA